MPADAGAVPVTAGVAVVAVAEVLGVLLAVAGVLEADVDVIGVMLLAGTKFFGAAVPGRASRIA